MKADERRARAIVRARSMNLCEICGSPAESMHHRRFRSQGGPWAPSNLLHLCGDGTRLCHGMLTDTQGKRKQYEGKGWIVASWQSWATTPVVLGYRDHPAILDDGGGVRDATDDELLACLALGFGVDLKEA